MRVAEFIKLNRHLSFDPWIQETAETLVAKLSTVPDLTEYTEEFKRTCLQSYRDAARKKVYAFYFSRCQDLCDDVIEKILTYV